MNLILFEPEELRDGGEVVLEGRRADHIRQVLRASVGDRLRVGQVGGRIGEGRVTAMDAGTVRMAVVLNAPPPPPLAITLLLALPRPKALRRVVQTVVTLGIKRLALFGAFRVEKAYWTSPWLEAEALHEQVMQGLEQAGDTMPPVITTHRLFKPFVEDEVPLLAAGSRCLVAHPGEHPVCPASIIGPVTLAIGPEGGFTPYEVALLQACGFVAVGLGPRILRTEQAVPALIGRLMAPTSPAGAV